jgi:hypothetical protein
VGFCQVATLSMAIFFVPMLAEKLIIVYHAYIAFEFLEDYSFERFIL